MVDVIPGILEKEWSVIESKITLVAPYVSWVQIDVADNTWVPNTTFLDFAAFTPFADKPSLAAHLILAHPKK